MIIEVGAPASLPLGLVRLEQDGEPKTCLLGLTLQHPPVNLSAQAHGALNVTGARADVGYGQANAFVGYHQLATKALIEIELATPAHVGLSSEITLGLSIAKALAWTNDMPYENVDVAQLAGSLGLHPRHASAVWGFKQGGLLLVETASGDEQLPRLLRRQEIAHEERNAWAFVFWFPRLAKGTPLDFEEQRLNELLRAAPHLSPDSGRLVTRELWPATERDDIVAFGRSVQTLHEMNLAALAASGSPQTLTKEERRVQDLMREHGALTFGRALTGLGHYGLIRGGDASRTLRKRLRDHVGFYGGIVMATITDNVGSRHVIREGGLKVHDYPPIRPRK